MGVPVPVTVVAHDPMLRAGAISVLSGCAELAVVPPPATGRVAVVLVDRVDGSVVELVRTIRAAEQRPEVVLVADDLDPAQAADVLTAGARGLLRRAEADPVRLTRAVLAAAVGDCTVAPGMFTRLLERPRPAAGGGVPLSEREQAVLRMVADGRETGEIARELCYSARTVVGVIHDITRRFRLRNRAHAVAWALREGVL